jgi:hypothetical protein
MFYDGAKGWRDVKQGRTRDEALKIAANIAKLPELLRKLKATSVQEMRRQDVQSRMWVWF